MSPRNHAACIGNYYTNAILIITPAACWQTDRVVLVNGGLGYAT
jgi:hypothetical protein